jgi:hypothetical protein
MLTKGHFEVLKSLLNVYRLVNAKELKRFEQIVTDLQWENDRAFGDHDFEKFKVVVRSDFIGLWYFSTGEYKTVNEGKLWDILTANKNKKQLRYKNYDSYFAHQMVEEIA